ncbi:MAG: cysteine desulfurase NifS [Ruminococcaceae bacterium]|nr:cysteine desulfurase NifS [Oscillospiraceae bacterium]
MSRFVYADNAATTPVLPEVADVMRECFLQDGMYGNPSSLYKKGQEANKALNDARAKIAGVLNCKPTEIFFTSCGSESDNWAIKGAARANVKKGKHLITTKIEHHAVLYTMEALEKEGFEVTYLDVDSDGLVSAEQVREAIRPDTTLVAIMYANNEIGTIEPIKEIAAVCREKKVICFTDAVQAVGNVKIDLADLGVDMLSFSGHKIHAPKGIGALYIKTGTRVHNFLDGGGQERGRRGGTENVAFALALAKALEIADGRLDELDAVKAKRDRLITELKKIPRSILNGSEEKRLPGNVNFSFECIEGESLLLLLDSMGICASTGSACSSRSLEPSHVLLAIGLPVEHAHGSLRLSITHETTDEDIDYILECVPKVVSRLRAMSPLWNE